MNYIFFSPERLFQNCVTATTLLYNVLNFESFVSQENFGWPGFAGKGAGGPGGPGFGIGGMRGPPPGMMKNSGPGGSWSGTGSGSGSQSWGESTPTYGGMSNQNSSCIVLKNLTPQVSSSDLINYHRTRSHRIMSSYIFIS